MSDRESDVRDTASKSLSLLICFCDDKDKLTSLVDSCLDVIVDDTIPIDNGLQVNADNLPGSCGSILELCISINGSDSPANHQKQ